MPSSRIEVCIEAGSRRFFASALEWPGWSRSGKTEEAALAALAEYADRYDEVAKRAGQSFPLQPSLYVVERVTGDATTDFGAPSIAAEAERRAVTAAKARRRSALVEAAWATLAEVANSAPAQLRKGPRGGGRDRDAMVEHVISAEAAYARKIGVKVKPPVIDDLASIEAMRAEIAAVLSAASDGSPPVERGWPLGYAARRIAWHVLDHAWEMQDRST